MAAEDEVSVANRSTHRTRCSVVTGAATPHRRSRVTPVASVDLGDLAQDGSSAEPNVGVRAISPPRRARNRQDRPTTHSHRRLLDSATEPRMVAARLTDRGCFRRWRHATSSSPWSPPTVQMCHLSDPTGSLLASTRQDGYNGPGRLGESGTQGRKQPRNRWGSNSGYGASPGARSLAQYPFRPPVGCRGVRWADCRWVVRRARGCSHPHHDDRR